MTVYELQCAMWTHSIAVRQPNVTLEDVKPAVGQHTAVAGKVSRKLAPAITVSAEFSCCLAEVVGRSQEDVRDMIQGRCLAAQDALRRTCLLPE